MLPRSQILWWLCAALSGLHLGITVAMRAEQQLSRALCCHGSLQPGGSVALKKGRGAWWWGGRQVICLLAFVSPSSVKLCMAAYAADLEPASLSHKARNGAKTVCHAWDDLDCNFAKRCRCSVAISTKGTVEKHMSASRKLEFNVSYLCELNRKKRGDKSKPILLGSFLWRFLFLTKVNFPISVSSYDWGQ